MDRLAVEEAVKILRTTAVPAQQAMLAENPEVAWFGGCLVWWRRNLIRIGQSFLHAGIEQLGQPPRAV